MGLFSTKKKTYVNTSVTRMVEDDFIINPADSATLEYITQGGLKVRTDSMSYADYIKQATQHSSVHKFKAARAFASKGKYAYGATEGNIFIQHNVDLNAEFKAYMERSLGDAIELVYVIFGPMNNQHFTWRTLVEDYGYNPTTNELTVLSQQKGTKCYLQDFQIAYCPATIRDMVDPDLYVQHGYAATHGPTDFRSKDITRKHTPWVKVDTATKDSATIYVSTKTANGQENVFTFDIDYLEYEVSGESMEPGIEDGNGVIDPTVTAPIVADSNDGRDYYQAFYKDSNGNYVYFTYEMGTGGYSFLDTLYRADSQLGQYNPRLYARMYGRRLIDDEYIGTDEYASSVKLGNKLDIDWHNWVEDIHENISDLDKVTQIFMTTSLAVNTDDPMINEYMYMYFSRLYDDLPDAISDSSYRDIKKEMIKGYAKPGITVQLKDKVYTQQITFKGIGYEDLEGSIGPIGTIKHQFYNQSYRYGSGFLSALINLPVHVFRKQITANVYREYSVYGLATTEYVEGGHTTTASGDSENLILPLDMAIIRELPFKTRSMLMAKSMHLVLNTVQVVKKKWYERGIFKAIMFIAAVVLAMWTGGQSITLYAVIYATVQTIVATVVLKALIRIMVVKWNLDAGVIFAVIAVGALMYGAYLSASQTTGVAGVTAQQMMTYAQQAFKLSNAGYAEQQKELFKTYREYGMEMEAKVKELEERQKELGIDDISNPYFLLASPLAQIDIRTWEQPSDYLERVLGTTGISNAVLEFPTNYADMKVQLPTIMDTMRNLEDML
jgi:hypothetical protein